MGIGAGLWVLAGSIQLRVAEPSVDNMYPLVPPDICRLLTLPKVTLDSLIRRLPVVKPFFTLKYLVLTVPYIPVILNQIVIA
jgi:hypothetical protein